MEIAERIAEELLRNRREWLLNEVARHLAHKLFPKSDNVTTSAPAPFGEAALNHDAISEAMNRLVPKRRGRKPLSPEICEARRLEKLKRLEALMAAKPEIAALHQALNGKPGSHHVNDLAKSEGADSGPEIKIDPAVF